MGKYVTTYLLGAGFSRSAQADLPLSCDFFDRVRAEKIGGTPHLQVNPSLQNLDEFVTDFFPQSPDLEDVMSFLSQHYFPQGFRQHWQHRNDIYIELLDLIASTYGKPMTVVPRSRNVLKQFSQKLVHDGSNVLMFNYDCILDSFLAETGAWDCRSGYGTLLRHISDCFHEVRIPEGTPSSMSLLKLHGSVNWGIPEMSSHESEHAEIFYSAPDLSGIGSNIAHAGVNLPVSKGLFHGVGFRPFIVPPIFDKSQSYQARFLRRLWYLAREILSVSDRIIIIGYSFPPTDYMARFLFKEAFGMHLAKHNARKVIVVNNICDTDYKRRVAPIVTDGDMEFVQSDALAYVESLCQEPTNNQDKADISLKLQMHRPRMPFLPKNEAAQ